MTGSRAARGFLAGAGAAAVAVAAAVATTSGADPSRTVEATRLGEHHSAPCPELRLHEHRVRGGCPLTVGGSRVTFSVVSVFGDEDVGRCPMRMTMRVGPAGELGLDRIEIADGVGPEMIACGDLVACREKIASAREGDPSLPWSGQLETTQAGSLAARIDVCLDTCFGRFEGPARFPLEPRPDGSWRTRAGRTTVGVSGLELSARWRVAPRPGDRVRLAPPG